MTTTTHHPALEWKPLWDAMDAQPNDWIETTEKMWWDMLECVPPRAQKPGVFLVGEPQRYNEKGEAIHACFRARSDGRHFAKYMTVAEFNKT